MRLEAGGFLWSAPWWLMTNGGYGTGGRRMCFSFTAPSFLKLKGNWTFFLYYINTYPQRRGYKRDSPVAIPLGGFLVGPCSLVCRIFWQWVLGSSALSLKSYQLIHTTQPYKQWLRALNPDDFSLFRENASWRFHWPSGANFPAQEELKRILYVPLWLLCACLRFEHIYQSDFTRFDPSRLLIFLCWKLLIPCRSRGSRHIGANRCRMLLIPLAVERRDW